MRRATMMAAMGLLAVAGGCTPTGDAFTAEMRELARIGAGMIDGEECTKIITPRAAKLMFLKHKTDLWFGADNYEVDHATFVRVKKLLIRLGRLAEFPVDCNLWLIARAKPLTVHAVIRQVNNWSLFYGFGEMHKAAPPEMAEVLTTGKTLVTTRRGKRLGTAMADFVAVLTPVRNSLGDVVGLIEICAPRPAAGAKASR